MCYFSLKYTGDLDTAKEIVHGVFIRIWENRSAFEWEKPAKSYLFTSVYNRSMNYIRDNKRLIRQENAPALQLIADEAMNSDPVVTAELENTIKLSLQRLPEKCREVFELSRYEHKKYAEIAEQLNISVKTVETHMSKALQLLRVALKDFLMITIMILLKNMPDG